MSKVYAVWAEFIISNARVVDTGSTVFHTLYGNVENNDWKEYAESRGFTDKFDENIFVNREEGVGLVLLEVYDDSVASMRHANQIKFADRTIRNVCANY